MEEWIRSTLASGQGGLATIPAAFLFGVLGSVSSCCTLPVLGAVAGYAGGLGDRRGRRELLLVGLFFAVGTFASLAVLGAVAGFVGHVAGASLGRYWRFAAGLVVVVFGLIAVGLIPIRFPGAGPARRRQRLGFGGALLYGLALGGGTTACAFGCNPLLPMAMSAAVLGGATVLGGALLASFALGYCLPLTAGILGIGIGIERLGRIATRLAPVARIGGGILLLAVGFYLLAGL